MAGNKGLLHGGMGGMGVLDMGHHAWHLSVGGGGGVGGRVLLGLPGHVLRKGLGGGDGLEVGGAEGGVEDEAGVGVVLGVVHG